MNQNEKEDKKLISDYLSGDERSLEILIARYIKSVYNFAHRNVGKIDMAEDITQEVFIKVWKNLKKYDPDKDFKPWIFQITKNASIDYLRKKKTIPMSNFENENGQNFFAESIAEKPFNIIENLSDKKVLADALQNIPDQSRKLINMRNEEGMSFKEISEDLKESINTVKSRYRRALAVLKKNIK